MEELERKWVSRRGCGREGGVGVGGWEVRGCLARLTGWGEAESQVTDAPETGFDVAARGLALVVV